MVVDCGGGGGGCIQGHGSETESAAGSDRLTETDSTPL